MACGYAKFTGKLGVCLATSGPGGIHLLNGLYDAKLDGQPVLAITGLQFHDLIGTYTQQDVALDKLFMDVAVFNERVMGPTHVENLTDLACRTALAYRGVAHLAFPVDLQEKELKERQRSKRNVAHHTSDVDARSARIPDPTELARAAEILNEGKKVAILAGRGALNAGDELEQVADLMGAPIIKALLGKAAVPDDSPYTTGGIGLLGTRPSQEAIEDCDTLLMVGTSFPYIEFMPKPGQARGVQIELDPKRIGLRYAVEVGLIGDSRNTLRELIPLLQRKQDRKFLQAAQAGMKDWRELIEKRATRTETPMYDAEVESVHYPRNALDVLAQQIVAMVAIEPWSVDEMYRVVRSAAAYGGLTRTSFESVLDMSANVTDASGGQIVTYRGLRRTTARGNPDERLWVYRRTGEPCRRCGSEIQSRKQGPDARTTFWCPQCQPG